MLDACLAHVWHMVGTFGHGPHRIRIKLDKIGRADNANANNKKEEPRNFELNPC